MAVLKTDKIAKVYPPTCKAAATGDSTGPEATSTRGPSNTSRLAARITWSTSLAATVPRREGSIAPNNGSIRLTKIPKLGRGI